MAECECFELTLLICEQVLKGQKESRHPTSGLVSEGCEGGVGRVDLHLGHLKTPLKTQTVRRPAFCAANAGRKPLRSCLALTRNALENRYFITHLHKYISPSKDCADA